MASRRQIARDLAAALSIGAWQREALLDRATRLFGTRPAWLPMLVDAVLARFDPRAPPPDRLADFIAAHPAFIPAPFDRERLPVIRHYPLDGAVTEPAPGFVTSPLPDLATAGDVAGWLWLSAGELAWMADPEGRQRRIGPGPLRHYRCRWIPKRQGPPRLLEVPKARLKRIQRKLLREVLDPVPPHPAAHGFRRGHSCRSYAEPHCGQALVLRFDLVDFFGSIPAARVHALFRELSYPWTVARLLTGLCSNAVATDRLDGVALPGPQRQRLHHPHLPQGAPTSPALANLCAFGLDRRLSGLARARGMRYTRYADDLAFSGERLSDQRIDSLSALVGAIALEEGFALNHRKTRRMRASQAQRLTGLMVNRHPSVPRADYDALKALLFNCVRHGPASQNHGGHPDFRAHLAGRVGYVARLNPVRGNKLRALYARIPWDTEPTP